MGRGRTPKKVENLRRFVEQWVEFTDDEPALMFADDDVKYVAESLHLEGPGLSKYYAMADDDMEI